MSTIPSLRVLSATELVTGSGIWEKHHPEWAALLGWCKLHGLDVHTMPVTNRIVRNVERCRIEYDAIVLDEHGQKVIVDDELQVHRVVKQGETPPMPWPPELEAMRS